ncbi:MAG: hypothetical protein JO125_06225 [Chloroflexi bacterium]|nr:hypothetical protein [Ktedonobacteraceae bacterium]MBV9706984.1 hypothetical protein [Chloroflexota bacterium]
MKTRTSLTLYVKCAAILLLFTLSVLIVACGNKAGSAQLGDPVVTVTIHLGEDQNASPTPTLSPYWCGAWATQTSPAYYSTSSVGVYAKFTQNIGGNPRGVGGASATATVIWPDGSTITQAVTTSADGLAVFSIPTTDRASAINKITLVTVTFQKIGLPTCTVKDDQAAFFTLVVVTPTPTSTGTPSTTGTPNPIETVFPIPGGFGLPTVTTIQGH